MLVLNRSKTQNNNNNYLASSGLWKSQKQPSLLPPELPHWPHVSTRAQGTQEYHQFAELTGPWSHREGRVKSEPPPIL